MTVLIGHASISEKGTVNGAKGDSTKKEVCTRSFYDKPWDFVAIHPDPKVREKHAEAVEDACANNNIGYGQDDRNTLNDKAKKVNYDLSKVGKCNCDCSSLQNVAAMASGAPGVKYGSNGWVTSNMEKNLKAAGYKIIKDSAYLKSAAYCVRGAIYVKSGSHTVCGLTNGSKAAQTLKKAGIPSSNTGTTVSSAVKAEGAQEFDKTLAGTYKTTTGLNMRTGAGTDKKIMLTVPEGASVRNYGYYTEDGTGKKWLYVTYKGVTGFCSSKCLKK